MTSKGTTSKGRKRSAGQGEHEEQPPRAPETQQREAGASESREQSSQPPAEHRYRSQRTDLLEGDPAGTAFSEEMGHTPTRE